MKGIDMGRPSTRALLFYQELLAVREAIHLVPDEHKEALKRVEQHIITAERTRLSNARHKSSAEPHTVEQSIEFGKRLMALPSEQERIAACRMASAVQKSIVPQGGLPRMGWWGGEVPHA
jgi:hypothetical protein